MVYANCPLSFSPFHSPICYLKHIRFRPNSFSSWLYGSNYFVGVKNKKAVEL